MNTPEPTPSDLANGLRHAADDHPCCASVLLASAELIDRLEAREAARVTDGEQRLVRRLRRKINRDWKDTWNRYPIRLRTPEETEIVDRERLRVNGYLEALEDLQANADLSDREN